MSHSSTHVSRGNTEQNIAFWLYNKQTRGIGLNQLLGLLLPFHFNLFPAVGIKPLTTGKSIDAIKMPRRHLLSHRAETKKEIKWEHIHVPLTMKKCEWKCAY